ncbi:MAG TPA: hypothetical protein VIV58_26575 [Kofleriaceae bacterium]
MSKRMTADGQFRYGRELGRHRFEGNSVSDKHRVMLTELDFTDQSPDQLRARFDYALEGVAPLRAVTELPHSGVFPNGAVLVEELPPGASLAEKRVTDRDRGRVAHELARTVARATSRGMALHGLRPDLVVVGDAVTLVPRSVDFLTQRSTRVKTLDGDGSFGEDNPIDFFIDPTLLLEADPRVDIYLLGLVISWTWTGQHAFAKAAKTSFHGYIFDAMQEGARDAWAGPPEIDTLVGAMLALDAAKRPGIDEVVDTLARFVANG